MLQLTFQPDQTTQNRRQNQARDRDPDNGGHLILEEVVSVLHCRHKDVSWLDFITAKPCPKGFLSGMVNRRDYRESRCAQ